MEARTDYCFNVFFCAGSATVRFERAARAQCKGQSFIVFAKVVIDLARKQRSLVMSFLRELLTLVERFTERTRQTKRWQADAMTYMSAMCSEISAQN